MLTFKCSMDPHSVDVERDGVFVGFLQWHPGRDPRFVSWSGSDGMQLTLTEMQGLINKYEEIKSEQ